jgi:acetate---CoA ligase (ADP-forming)
MSDWGEAAFNPSSIALVGASAKSSKLGYILMRNLLEGYPGKLYPINPGETEIMGQQAYPRLLDVPGQVDLAVIALPTEACVEAMRDCAKIGAKAALVLSGGFAEVGPDGQARQEALFEAARAGGVRLIGPNCFGLYNCNLGLNASMGFGLPPKGGSISLVTQSGAYGMAIFGLAQQRHLRFAKILSHGNKADLADHEILNYFEQDDETRVLCLFLESVSDGRAFYEALVRVAQRKPVVIAKTGRSSAGRRAAASHTAALTGDATAFVTAVRQAGAILAESGLEMVDIAEALSRQPLPPGRRVAIITNSGGTGVELADMCERFGLSVPELPEDTQARISPLIPAYASPRNPVDVTPAWARFPEMYAGSIEALYACNEVDIIIPILLQRSALMRENVEAVSEAVLRCQRERGLAKPTYACWVVGREGDENQAILQEAGIPVYEWPERTARTAAAIAAYSENHHARAAAANVIPSFHSGQALSAAKDLHAHAAAANVIPGAAANVILSEAKDPVPPPAAREQAGSVLARARTENRTSLLESEVKALLAAYGARIPRETLCTSPAEATAAGQILGKACVLKIVSPDISHKSDSGGVRVGVLPADVGAVFEEMLAEVRTRQPTARILGVSVQELVHGQEVIIGGMRDSEFGAMLMFGLGGVFVETLRDVAYRLVPASANELHAMIHEVRGYPLLAGIRGQAAANLEKLTELLQVTAHLLEAFPEIVELDLNPVFAGPEEAIVADGRAVLAER